MKYAILVLGLITFGMVSCAPTNTSANNGRVISLNAIGNFANGTVSTAKGKAELNALTDGKTKIIVTVSGLTPNTKHVGHIHLGKCATPGPVAVALTELNADANGKASGETLVDTNKIPTSAYIQHHQRGTGEAEGAGAGIVCGDII
jgi:hypothetical protein